jgi:delta-1-pyrroline-5-carboxylate synthetase
VVANEHGRPSLTRLGALTEQIAELHEAGVQVILVSSGAVGMGKRLLQRQGRMMMSFRDSINAPIDETPQGQSGFPAVRTRSFASLLEDTVKHTPEEKNKFYDSACAAAGQFDLMNLYSNLFNQYDMAASQILLTQVDFTNPDRLENLKYTVERLLSNGLVPIINENDAVSANLGYTADNIFSDNDSLAAICARTFSAEVLLLLTDVEGVYDRPPSKAGAEMLEIYVEKSSEVSIGEKSAQGRLQDFCMIIFDNFGVVSVAVSYYSVHINVFRPAYFLQFLVQDAVVWLQRLTQRIVLLLPDRHALLV